MLEPLRTKVHSMYCSYVEFSTYVHMLIAFICAMFLFLGSAAEDHTRMTVASLLALGTLFLYLKDSLTRSEYERIMRNIDAVESIIVSVESEVE